MEQQKQIPKPRQKDDSCRIKIRNTKNGKDIKFEGKCSRSQLSMASGNIEDALGDED